MTTATEHICPDCLESCATAQGLAAHRRGGHCRAATAQLHHARAGRPVAITHGGQAAALRAAFPGATAEDYYRWHPGGRSRAGRHTHALYAPAWAEPITWIPVPLAGRVAACRALRELTLPAAELADLIATLGSLDTFGQLAAWCAHVAAGENAWHAYRRAACHDRPVVITHAASTRALADLPGVVIEPHITRAGRRSQAAHAPVWAWPLAVAVDIAGPLRGRHGRLTLALTLQHLSIDWHQEIHDWITDAGTWDYEAGILVSLIWSHVLQGTPAADDGGDCGITMPSPGVLFEAVDALKALPRGDDDALCGLHDARLATALPLLPELAQWVDGGLDFVTALGLCADAAELCLADAPPDCLDLGGAS